MITNARNAKYSKSNFYVTDPLINCTQIIELLLFEHQDSKRTTNIHISYDGLSDNMTI